MKRVASLAACVLCGGLAIAPAGAQTSAPSYPERAVRLIVPFPAGGATDILARLLADRLAIAWSKPVVIDNIGGAAGAIGTAQAAKATPDGYSLLMGTGTTTTLLVNLRSNLPFDPMHDFATVALICTFPNILVVRADLPAKDMAELIALLRANPGKYTFASSGYGSSIHLAGEWFRLATKTEILHVPFTGSAPALQALLGGHVDMMFDTMPSVWPLVAEGKLRALGVASAERVPSAPGVPAIAETLPGFDVTSWLGILVPVDTPADIRAKIAAQLMQILSEATITQRMTELGALVAYKAPNEFAAFMQNDFQKWQRVTAETGIKAKN